MSGLSLQDIEWLTEWLRSIEEHVIAIRQKLDPPRVEAPGLVKTDRPADAGETKW